MPNGAAFRKDAETIKTVLGVAALLQNLFKSRRVEEPDDHELIAAREALNERLLDMLERESLRKIRFSNWDNTPSYLR